MTRTERLRIFEEHKNLITVCTARYARRVSRENLEDMRQDAALALWKFIDSYNPAKAGDMDLTSWYKLKINGAVIDGIRERTNCGIGRNHDAEEYVAKARKFYVYLNSRYHYLDSVPAENPWPLIEGHIALYEAIASTVLLTENECEAIEWFLAGYLAFHEIAYFMGVNESRVSQLINGAVRKMGKRHGVYNTHWVGHA